MSDIKTGNRYLDDGTVQRVPIQPEEGTVVAGPSPIAAKAIGRPKRVEPWPWEVLGLTRTTYYRLRKQGKLT